MINNLKKIKIIMEQFQLNKKADQLSKGDEVTFEYAENDWRYGTIKDIYQTDLLTDEVLKEPHARITLNTGGFIDMPLARCWPIIQKQYFENPNWKTDNFHLRDRVLFNHSKKDNSYGIGTIDMLYTLEQRGPDDVLINTKKVADIRWIDGEIVKEVELKYCYHYKNILKQKYETVVDEYLKEFCTQFEFDYEDADYYWVAGEVGGIIELGDYFLSFETIKTVIDNNIPYETWVGWYDYTLRLHSISTDITVPNLMSYFKGCPVKDEKEIEKLEQAKKNVEYAENLFINMLKESVENN
jgi:hypothetical protein